MSRVLVLLRKELLEVRRSRGLLFAMAALPATMLSVPILLVLTAVHATDADAANLLGFYRAAAPAVADPRQAFVLLAVQNCVALFLVMPLFIPVLIAAQSIAGEKERHTIEPLLASPLRSAEIVLGKSLGAVVPALGITGIAFVLFAAAVDGIAWPVFGRPVLPDAAWTFAVLVLAPLLCFLGNTVTVLVSSRVGDSRLAQQISALLVVPLLALVSVQFTGLLYLGPWFYLWLGLGAAVLDAALFALAVRLFDRQRILTRWG